MDGELYRAIGGAAQCRRLSAALYARIKKDPLLRPLFPGKTLHCAIEEFAAFLIQFLGGPSEESQRRWWLSLRESHLRFRIGPKERSAWLGHIVKALDDAQIEEPLRTAARDFFERSSSYVINTVSAETSGSCIHREFAERWKAQQALDELVAAVRGGDAERAISLAEGSALQAYFNASSAVFAGLLAKMIENGNSPLIEYVREKLDTRPAIASERYGGRTLLHCASGAGNLPIVEALLRVGADPNAASAGGHTPLYYVGNECKAATGADVVGILVHAGADVNACDGVKRCTPLHMAARQGNAEVAEALLDCGADVEARDSLGETPLRRAVNCNKTTVAALLVSRGADVQSKGSKGMTPQSAARTSAMKLALTARRSSIRSEMGPRRSK